MYVKLVSNDGSSTLYQTFGDLSYGTLFVSETEISNVDEETVTDELLDVLDDELSPVGYGVFDISPKPDNVTSVTGTRYWNLRWAQWKNDEGYLRRLVTSGSGEIYILGDNGKTLDRVK